MTKLYRLFRSAFPETEYNALISTDYILAFFKQSIPQEQQEEFETKITEILWKQPVPTLDEAEKFKEGVPEEYLDQLGFGTDGIEVMRMYIIERMQPVFYERWSEYEKILTKLPNNEENNSIYETLCMNIVQTKLKRNAPTYFNQDNIVDVLGEKFINFQIFLKFLILVDSMYIGDDRIHFVETYIKKFYRKEFFPNFTEPQSREQTAFEVEVIKTMFGIRFCQC